MNEFRIRATGQVVTEEQYRAMHSESVLPKVLVPEDADAVLQAPVPAITDFQTVYRDGVVQDALGNWVHAWKIVDWAQARIDAFKADAKETKLVAIKAERDRRRFEGGVKVNGHWFLSTVIATAEYSAMSLISAGLPDTTVIRQGWRTMDGAEIDMTPALAKQIITAGFYNAAAIDDAAQVHVAAMNAAYNPATYDFMGSWPTAYGEEDTP